MPHADRPGRGRRYGMLLLGALCAAGGCWLYGRRRANDASDWSRADDWDSPRLGPTSPGVTEAYAEATAAVPPIPQEAATLQRSAETEAATPVAEPEDSANDATQNPPPTEGKLDGLTPELSGREFPREQATDVYEAEALALQNDSTDPEKVVAGGEPGAMPGDRQPLGYAANVMDQGELTPDFSQQK